jgi:hypothetical protein
MPAGTVGTIHSKDLLSTVSILNDVGGTTFLPHGDYRVEIERSFHDYETGVRMIGFLLDEADIALATEAGTTGYKYEPKPSGDPRLDALMKRHMDENRTRRVFFSGRAFEPAG